MLQVRFTNDTLLEAGIDESGRGCLWGPLYAASVIWPPEEEWTEEYREVAPLIQDSKKVSPKKRAAVAESIKALAVDYGIGSVTANEIDEHGKVLLASGIDEALLDGDLFLDLLDDFLRLGD